MRDPVTGTVWVDNSTLVSVATCTTKAVLQKVHGFQRSEDGIPAEAGKAIHSGLDARFRTGSTRAALAAFEVAYSEYAIRVVHPAADQRDRYDCYRYGNVKTILAEWLDRHPDSALPWTVLPDGTEAELSYPLTDEVLPNGAPRFMYWGKIDLRVRGKHDGRRYTVDHKSSQKIGPGDLARYDNDSQMSGYTWLESKLSPPDDQPAGVFINAIGVKVVPTSDRKCAAHKLPYAQCGPLHLDFVIHPVGCRPDQIAQWHRDAVRLAEQYEHLLNRYGQSVVSSSGAPMDGTFRNECKYCTFRDFCLSGREDTDWLTRNFTVDRWLPAALQKGEIVDVAA